MSNKSYRIRTDVNGEDKVLKVNLKQGVKTINILSLEINPEDLYELHTSDYGVIVGRVLANEAMGVPNVKISVFIPIDDADKDDYIISNEYPYTTPQSKDINGVRYNLLVNKDGTPGSFPSKKMLLDNDGCVEVFDKYWKYTTTSNESGDYMIFGVPTGSCQIHYDCDLSDIGMLSQHPYDLIAKGYSENLFNDVSKFTEDDLDRSVHIISQDITTYVYPFWGDKTRNQIGITRNDININYKFEPSCVFMGSCVTDPVGSYIDEYGKPNGVNGVFESLETSVGDIEVIRKKEDGSVEELKDNVWGIIDGNGVWCYQIPMNLDRIGTDEYGNMISINDPTKGIPTRARVRFRITLTSGAGGVGGNTAKMLIPCNPKLQPGGSHEPYPGEYDGIYEFGTNTPDRHFRDLYWGKVYSVRQFYTRFHYEDQPKPVMRLTDENCYRWYDGLLVDIGDWDKPKALMYNYRGYPPQFAFRQSCISSCDMVDGLNLFPYTTLYAGPEVSIDYSLGYWFYYHMSEDTGNERMVEKGLHFCFENDWVNGCLYFPRVAISEKGYFGIKNDNSNSATYDNVYISGRHYYYFDNTINSNSQTHLPMGGFTTKYYTEDEKRKFNLPWWGENVPGRHCNEGPYDTWYNEDYVWIFTRAKMQCGIITRKQTMLGENVYYYRCCGTPGTTYSRIYPTDIILLGNLEDVYDYLPHLYDKLPSTSAIFPPVGTSHNLEESGMSKHCSKYQIERTQSEDADLVDIYGNYTTSEDGYLLYDYGTGDYEYHDEKNVLGNKYYNGVIKNNLLSAAYSAATDENGDADWQVVFSNILRRTSLFFHVDTYHVHDFMGFDIPSFVNLSRICELGVDNDRARGNTPTNGIIDGSDIIDAKSRNAFAQMNFDINRYTVNELGNRQLVCTPMNITNFDGRLHGFAGSVANGGTGLPNNGFESCNRDYMRFRFGEVVNEKYTVHVQEQYEFYPEYKNEEYHERKNNIYYTTNYANGPLYLPDNSFYFYFGLRAGATALTALRDKFTGSDANKKVKKVGSISVVSNDGDQYCIDYTQYGSITVNLYDVTGPIRWTVYNGDLAVKTGVVDYSEERISGFTAGVNYRFVGVDKFENEYEQWFNIPIVSITYTCDFISYDAEAGKNRIRISAINDSPIEHVLYVQGDFEPMDGCGDSTLVECFSGGSGSRIFLSTYDDQGYSSFGRFARLIFTTGFDYWILDESNGWIDIYFPIGTTTNNMTIGIYRSPEGILGNPCPSKDFTIIFPEYIESSLELNKVPVPYISGWKKKEYWEASSIDVPDSEFESNDVDFNLFDSMNAAHPDYAITRWIDNNTHDVESCNRGYDFTIADALQLTPQEIYSIQLSAISNMFAAVNGDFGMSLKYNSGSNNNNNDSLISISPYYNGISSYINHPETTWEEYINGDVQYLSIVNIENTERTRSNNVTEYEVYSQYNNMFPHIVGSNYPRGINTRTMLRNGVEDVIIGYMNNGTMLVGNNSSIPIFSLNSFGVKSGVYPTLDKPSELYPRENLVEGACWHEINEYTGYFGVRTVDRRFDYRFAAQTPLLLPSGYENFNQLDKKAFIGGAFDIDLYGGIRLNKDADNNITCYTTAGDAAVEKFFGMNDNKKKTFIASYFKKEAEEEYAEVEGDNDAEIGLFRNVAGELCYGNVKNGLFNTKRKISDEYAEDWAIARYHKISGSTEAMKSWLKSSYDSFYLDRYNEAQTLEDKRRVIGSAATSYITSKLNNLTNYDAKRSYLEYKLRDLFIEKYRSLDSNSGKCEWFLTYYNINGSIHALRALLGTKEDIEEFFGATDMVQYKDEYDQCTSDDERLRYAFNIPNYSAPYYGDDSVFEGATHWAKYLLDSVNSSTIDLLAFHALSDFYDNTIKCQDEWFANQAITLDDIIKFNRTYDRRELILSYYPALINDFDNVTLSAQTLYLSGLTEGVYDEEPIGAFALSWLNKNANSQMRRFLSDKITSNVISAECKSIRDSLGTTYYDDLIISAYTSIVDSESTPFSNDGEVNLFNKMCYKLNRDWIYNYYQSQYNEFQANVLQRASEWVEHNNTGITATTIDGIISEIGDDQEELKSFYYDIICEQIFRMTNIVEDNYGQSIPGGSVIVSGPSGEESSPGESIGGEQPSVSDPSSPHSEQTRIIRNLYKLIFYLSSNVINYWKENTSISCGFIEKLFDGVYGYLDQNNNTYKYAEKLYDVISYSGIDNDIISAQVGHVFNYVNEGYKSEFGELNEHTAKLLWLRETDSGSMMWAINTVFTNRYEDTMRWIGGNTNGITLDWVESGTVQEYYNNFASKYGGEGEKIWKNPAKWVYNHGGDIIAKNYEYEYAINNDTGDTFIINEYVNYMKYCVFGNKEDIFKWLMDVGSGTTIDIFIGGNYDIDGDGHNINGYCENWIFNNFELYNYYNNEDELTNIIDGLNWSYSDDDDIDSKRNYLKGSIVGIFREDVLEATKGRIESEDSGLYSEISGKTSKSEIIMYLHNLTTGFSATKFSTFLEICREEEIKWVSENFDASHVNEFIEYIEGEQKNELIKAGGEYLYESYVGWPEYDITYWLSHVQNESSGLYEEYCNEVDKLAWVIEKCPSIIIGEYEDVAEMALNTWMKQTLRAEIRDEFKESPIQRYLLLQEFENGNVNSSAVVGYDNLVSGVTRWFRGYSEDYGEYVHDTTQNKRKWIVDNLSQLKSISFWDFDELSQRYWLMNRAGDSAIDAFNELTDDKKLDFIAQNGARYLYRQYQTKKLETGNQNTTPQKISNEYFIGKNAGESTLGEFYYSCKNHNEKRLWIKSRFGKSKLAEYDSYFDATILDIVKNNNAYEFSLLGENERTSWVGENFSSEKLSEYNQDEDKIAWVINNSNYSKDAGTFSKTTDAENWLCERALGWLVGDSSSSAHTRGLIVSGYTDCLENEFNSLSGKTHINSWIKEKGGELGVFKSDTLSQNAMKSWLGTIFTSAATYHYQSISNNDTKVKWICDSIFEFAFNAFNSVDFLGQANAAETIKGHFRCDIPCGEIADTNFDCTCTELTDEKIQDSEVLSEWLRSHIDEEINYELKNFTLDDAKYEYMMSSGFTGYSAAMSSAYTEWADINIDDNDKKSDFNNATNKRQWVYVYLNQKLDDFDAFITGKQIDFINGLTNLSSKRKDEIIAKFFAVSTDDIKLKYCVKKYKEFALLGYEWATDKNYWLREYVGEAYVSIYNGQASAVVNDYIKKNGGLLEEAELVALSNDANGQGMWIQRHNGRWDTFSGQEYSSEWRGTGRKEHFARTVGINSALSEVASLETIEEKLSFIYDYFGMSYKADFQNATNTVLWQERLVYENETGFNRVNESNLEDKYGTIRTYLNGRRLGWYYSYYMGSNQTQFLKNTVKHENEVDSNTLAVSDWTQRKQENFVYDSFGSACAEEVQYNIDEKKKEYVNGFLRTFVDEKIKSLVNSIENITSEKDIIDELVSVSGFSDYICDIAKSNFKLSALSRERSLVYNSGKESTLDEYWNIQNTYRNSVRSRLWVYRKCHEWAINKFNNMPQKDKDDYIRSIGARNVVESFFGFTQSERESWIIEHCLQYGIDYFNTLAGREKDDWLKTHLNKYELKYYSDSEVNKYYNATSDLTRKYILNNQSCRFVSNRFFGLSYVELFEWVHDLIGNSVWTFFNESKEEQESIIQQYACYKLPRKTNNLSLQDNMASYWYLRRFLGVSDAWMLDGFYSGTEYCPPYITNPTNWLDKMDRLGKIVDKFKDNIYRGFNAEDSFKVYIFDIGGELALTWYYDLFHEDEAYNDKYVYYSISQFLDDFGIMHRENFVSAAGNAGTRTEELAKVLIARWRYTVTKQSGGYGEYEEEDGRESETMDRIFATYGAELTNYNFNEMHPIEKEDFIRSRGGLWALKMYNNAEYLRGYKNGDEWLTDYIRKTYLRQYRKLSDGYFTESEKRNFVYEYGGGNTIAGGPQRDETSEGANDWANLWSVEIGEMHEDENCPIDASKINETKINIWDFFTDIIETYNSNDAYLYEYIPAYTFQSDIDHVKYSIRDINGEEESGKTISFIASFTDCSTDFSDGIVKSGNTESFGVSYDSGVNVSGGTYDVEYTLDDVNGTLKEYYASLSGSDLTISLKPDEVWFEEGGVTYTDINTSGNDNSGVYPDWAAMSDGDIPEALKKELAVYVCEPNLLTQDGFTVDFVYPLDTYLNGAVHSDNSIGIAPFGVASEVVDEFFDKTLEEQEQFVYEKAGEEAVEKLETLSDEELSDYVVELGKFVSMTEFGLLETDEDKEIWVRNNVSDYITMLLTNGDVGTDSASQKTFIEDKFGLGSSDGFPEDASYNVRALWISNKASDVAWSSLSSTTESTRYNFVLSAACDMLQSEFNALIPTQEARNEWVANYTNTPESYENEGELNVMQLASDWSDVNYNSENKETFINNVCEGFYVASYLEYVNRTQLEWAMAKDGYNGQGDYTPSTWYNVFSVQKDRISWISNHYPAFRQSIVETTNNAKSDWVLNNFGEDATYEFSRKTSDESKLAFIRSYGYSKKLGELNDEINNAELDWVIVNGAEWFIARFNGAEDQAELLSSTAGDKTVYEFTHVWDDDTKKAWIRPRIISNHTEQYSDDNVNLDDGLKFKLDDSDPSLLEEKLPYNSFIIIPTRKVYRKTNAPTSLKQGVVYNRGFVYYTGSISAKTESGTVKLMLNSPLRGEDDVITYSSETLSNEYGWHTIGNVTDIYIDENSGINVSYDDNKCEFTISNIGTNTDIEFFFTIENGLRYKISLNLE